MNLYEPARAMCPYAIAAIRLLILTGCRSAGSFSYDGRMWWVPVAGRVEARGAAARTPSIARTCVAELEVDPGWVMAERAGSAALRRWGRPTMCRFATHPAIAKLHRELGPLTYRCSVILRSYLLPFAMPVERAGGTLGVRILDLDDDEATTRRRLADLDPDDSARQRLEAELYEDFEAKNLPWAHHLLVAQNAHAQRLRRRWPGSSVQVLPNAVRVSEDPRRSAGAAGAEASESSLDLLLVGNLTYSPNRAAARELALKIVPILRQSGKRVWLRLVGRRPPEDIVELGKLDGVELLTDEADLAPHYEWADLVILPLRAGGGTRIKILEAFAAGVPVIATSMAVDGLAARDGEHLLIAESAEDLAARSLYLTDQPDLRERLIAKALTWVRAHHDRSQVIEELADAFNRWS